jgi:hypothetical protein
MRRLILAWILVFAAWCGTSPVLAQSALKPEELDQLFAPIVLYPDSLQRLRQKAQANDKLKTTKQQKVATTQQKGRDYIVIEPAAPQTLYVPYYDPRFATACRGVELPLPA